MTAPFGIEFHTPVENYGVIDDLGQGRFSVTPPKPHPSFDTFVVQATPSIGVFWIKGISSTLDNDAYGTRARQVMDTLNNQLTKRYGPGKRMDNLMEGSIWYEPRDWAQSLSANERHCFVLWDRSGASSLPDDLDSIYLGANGHGSDVTNVCLEYSSNKMKEAEAELQDMLSDLL